MIDESEQFNTAESSPVPNTRTHTHTHVRTHVDIVSVSDLREKMLSRSVRRVGSHRLYNGSVASLRLTLCHVYDTLQCYFVSATPWCARTHTSTAVCVRAFTQTQTRTDGQAGAHAHTAPMVFSHSASARQQRFCLIRTSVAAAYARACHRCALSAYQTKGKPNRMTSSAKCISRMGE